MLGTLASVNPQSVVRLPEEAPPMDKNKKRLSEEALPMDKNKERLPEEALPMD